MLVASQIELHHKDNSPDQTLFFFFSSVDNLEEEKGILWFPVFPFSDLHLDWSIFIVISFILAILCIK